MAAPGHDGAGRLRLDAAMARELLLDPDQPTIRLRKRADILAIRMAEPFVVTTEHGDIGGDRDDYLATNDPAVDPGSDCWPISAERMTATYEAPMSVAESFNGPARRIPPVRIAVLIVELSRLRDRTAMPAGRELSLAITALEDAESRLSRAVGFGLDWT